MNPLEPAPASQTRPARSATEEERELVAAILRKDRKATAEFVARFADPVHTFVKWRLAPSVQAIDDLVQEVFLEACRSLPRYRGDASLQTRILGIARHKVQDHYRGALRLVDLDETVEAAQVEPAVAERELLHLERNKRVQQILADLPEAYWIVLLWRYWESQSAAKIAA